MNLFDIQGRKALVTGATRGLGWGMAEGLMEAGAEVVLWGSSAKAEAVAEDFRARGFACHGVTADLGDRENLRSAFTRSLELLGGSLDILVNCAGIQRRHPSENFPLEDWDTVLEINLTAPFQLCQLAGREMLKQGYGKIINIASMQSLFGGFTIPAYASAKGGIALLTKMGQPGHQCERHRPRVHGHGDERRPAGPGEPPVPRNNGPHPRPPLGRREGGGHEGRVHFPGQPCLRLCKRRHPPCGRRLRQQVTKSFQKRSVCL